MVQISLDTLKRTVIGVDPAVTSHMTSDETGIVVAALGRDGKIYVLDDLSGRYGPDEWAQRVVGAYHSYHADRVVAEINQGGSMVEHTLRCADPYLSYKGVRAQRGKRERAHPIVALYEAGHVYHRRHFPELEAQMCRLQGASDRLDALVWAISDLVTEGHGAADATPVVWVPGMGR